MGSRQRSKRSPSDVQKLLLSKKSPHTAARPAICHSHYFYNTPLFALKSTSENGYIRGWGGGGVWGGEGAVDSICRLTHSSAWRFKCFISSCISALLLLDSYPPPQPPPPPLIHTIFSSPASPFAKSVKQYKFSFKVFIVPKIPGSSSQEIGQGVHK